ncbi:hypothetical protein R1sor_019389 [Riccia sorocarpa]|uniref:Uncharacterized protein n=1 Tax=Riccia sorocarpa TaxID=122646 RepID=A0ABD3IGN0_9MARC
MYVPKAGAKREELVLVHTDSDGSSGDKKGIIRSRMQKIRFDHYHTRQSPDDVRFTKPTIDLNFPGQQEFENIYDVLSALEQKILQPRSLPSLRVFLHDNQLWTIDNKLLYIYRISPKVRRVSVTFITGIRFIDRFLNENSRSDKERMASPDFFPDVVRTSAMQVVQSSSSQDCVMLPTVAGFKKMEKERNSTGKAPSSPSAKSSRSNSSSRTVASHIASEDNAESNFTTDTEFNALDVKSLRTCTVRNDNSVDSSTNSSVKSYPVNFSNNCSTAKQEGDPNAANGSIYAEEFRDTAYGRLRQSTPESKARETNIEKDETRTNAQAQTPLSSRSFPYATRAVVECRDILVSDTPALVHILTEPLGSNFGWASPDCSVESKIDDYTLQFRPEAASLVRCCIDSPEGPSKWTEVDSLEAPPEMLGRFSTKSIMMNQFSSDMNNGMEGKDRCPYQLQESQQQQRYPSPSKKPGQTDSYNSSDSSRDRHSRLDRPLSSCGSSAPILERPSTCNFPLDGRRNGPVFRLCTTSGNQADRGNQSPPKPRTRAFMSAEKKMQGKLSREHELEVSKKILLKHMKKAFFSVY